MKKTALFIFLMMICVATYAAQEIKGTIVFPDKTVEVTLLVPFGIFGGDPNTESMQGGIKYRDANGKKKKLKPADATEFSFNYDGKVWRMVSSDYATGRLWGGSKLFLLQLIDGPVKLFEYTYTSRTGGGPNGMGMTTTTTINLMQRGNESIYEFRLFGFRKEMAEYFKDCPELVKLIEGKEFRRKDVMEIVHYYNYQCH